MRMVPKIRECWNSPYPYYYERGYLPFIALFVFGICFYITFVLTPHTVNTAEQRLPYVWICGIHALVPTLLLLVGGTVVSLLYPTDTRWTVGRELCFFGSLLLVIGLANFLVRDLIYDNPDNFSWYIFREELGNTFSIGILVAGLVVGLNHAIQLRRQKKRAATLRGWSVAEVPAAGSPRIAIETELKKDAFTLALDEFLLARANGNYTEIYLSDATGTKRLLKRIGLTAFMGLLADHRQIVRTHKSYGVNLYKIKDYHGNAAGLKLTLEEVPEITVPVSRKFIAAFEERLRHLRR